MAIRDIQSVITAMFAVGARTNCNETEEQKKEWDLICFNLIPEYDQMPKYDQTPGYWIVSHLDQWIMIIFWIHGILRICAVVMIISTGQFRDLFCRRHDDPFRENDSQSVYSPITNLSDRVNFARHLSPF